MTYHRGFGQAAPDTFTLDETEAFAAAHPPATTTTASGPTAADYADAGKTGDGSSPQPTGGKTGGGIPTWSPAPSSSAISSAAYSTMPSGGTPHWMPWAIGGTVAVLGLGLFLAARS